MMKRITRQEPLKHDRQALLSQSAWSLLIPTPKQMKSFALQFSPREWMELCKDRRFLGVVDKNLVEASAIASAVLKRGVLFFGAAK